MKIIKSGAAALLGLTLLLPVHADGMTGGIGAVAGGLLGSMFGQGNGRLAATAAGAVLGYATGQALPEQGYYGYPAQAYVPPPPPQPVYPQGYVPAPQYSAGYYSGPPQVIYSAPAYGYGGYGDGDGWRHREWHHREWHREGDDD